MPTKTREELLQEIEKKEKEITSLKSEVKRLEKYEQYNNAAGEIRAIYDSYILAGFSEKQAFKLIEVTAAASARPRLF